jgi:hypothetical protein
MSTIGMSSPAAYVLRSLMEHPERDTPSAIADGAPADSMIDEAAARDGLGELGSRGLATEGDDGRWRLTDRGLASESPS